MYAMPSLRKATVETRFASASAPLRAAASAAFCISTRCDTTCPTLKTSAVKLTRMKSEMAPNTIVWPLSE